MNTIPALDDTERQALNDALDDEYRAHATYEQVIGDFGPVQPFLICSGRTQCSQLPARRS